MRYLAAFALLAFCLSSCSRPDHAKTIIDHAGAFRCFHGQMLVTISDTPTDALNYTIGRKQSKVGPSNPSLHRGTPWAIYPETADSVWVFDGTKDVTHIEFAPDGGAKFTSNQVVPDMLKSAPPVFLNHLPGQIKSI